MSHSIRVAFLGDIVGAPGRSVLRQEWAALVERFCPDLVVANAENARDGSGLTPDLARTFLGMGIAGLTLGDHVYRDRKIVPLLEDPAMPIARPANLSAAAPGKRLLRLPLGDGEELFVITLLGRVSMGLPANDPFACADELLATLPRRDPIVLVEAHMEATSEKAALAHHLDGRVAAVLGTHTHVPTADARILRGGTGFITDVGMTGPYDSIIGRDPEAVLRHLTTSVHVPYAVGSGRESLCGCLVEIDRRTRRCRSLERIELPPIAGR